MTNASFVQVTSYSLMRHVHLTHKRPVDSSVRWDSRCFDRSLDWC